MRLGRWSEAQRVYEKALEIDPDNAHAHLGVCRMALRRRKFGIAAQSALDALQRIYHYPLAHFLLGQALAGMKEYERAAEAFRAAISFNPNFPEAHVRLAALLEKHLGDAGSAEEHRRLARRMRSGRAKVKAVRPAVVERVETAAPMFCVARCSDAADGGIAHRGDGVAAIGNINADADAGGGWVGRAVGRIARSG